MGFFSTEFNQVPTFLGGACGALGLAALTARRQSLSLASAFGSGVSAGAALFCSFGAVPMLGAVGALVIAVALRSCQPLNRITVLIGLAALGFVAVFAIPSADGYNHIAVARSVLTYHLGRFNQMRSKELWLPFNLLDFSVFAGWPVLAWGAVALVRSRARSPLLWTIFAVIAALDLADVTRGEVGRLWMPLTVPLYVATAVSAMQTRESERESLLVAPLLAVSTLVLTVFWITHA
jgi:hypothetical protein